MTLVPTTYRDLKRELDRPRSSLDLYPYDLLSNPRISNWWLSDYFRYPLLPWEQQLRELQNELLSRNYRWPWPVIQDDNGERMTVGENGLQIDIDVRQYRPSEVTVRTTDDYVIVEGNHRERNEGGHRLVERHFERKYVLPQGFNCNDVVSTLSSDGILTIKAPPPPPLKRIAPYERLVRIQHTDKASKYPALTWK